MQQSVTVSLTNTPNPLREKAKAALHKVTHPFSSKDEKKEQPAAAVAHDEQAAAAKAPGNTGESKTQQVLHKVAHPLESNKNEKKSPLGAETRTTTSPQVSRGYQKFAGTEKMFASCRIPHSQDQSSLQKNCLIPT